ncbi:MAG TPA: LamG-like jellyroll fold domain-containing protein, partial [Actinomycetes bacterium]|nr:LamG-like jellyroll fold domain-containing protein [Actinomycetes bacterium]
MIAALTRTRPRRPPVLAPSAFDPSQLPALRLWTPSTGATGGGSTAYASASSQYHFVTDKYALRCAGIAGGAALGIGIVGQFSLTTTAADQGLAGKCGNTADAAGIEYALQYIASPGRFRFVVSNGTSTVAVDASTAGAPAAGTWYSIAAWYDPAGGGSLNITVNDGAIDGAACSITPQGAAGEFRVGRVGAAYLNGRARNVAVLRRPPSAAERTALHAAGAGVTYADAPVSLKATWSLGGWWNLAIQRAGDRSYDQVRRPNIARKTGASLNGLTPGSTSPPAGFTGYQTFTQGATSYLGSLTSTLASSGPGFSGEINRFGPGLSLRLRVRRADTDPRYQGLWLNTANAVGFCIHNNRLAYFQGGSTYSEGGPTLAAGVWYDVGITAGVDAHWLLVLDG